MATTMMTVKTTTTTTTTTRAMCGVRARSQAAPGVKSSSSVHRHVTMKRSARCRAEGDERVPGSARQASVGEIETLVNPLIASTQTLNDGIAKFYDESSGLWEDVWTAEGGGDGTHMHHGYYAVGNRGENGGSLNHAQAQVDMITESLKWAGVDAMTRVVDVGCGIGGSSRFMAKKYGCQAEGVTLSPVQAARANTLSRQEGLGDKARYQVADALNMPFENGAFDFVWSMESGEHMPDKKKFVNELARVCAPGGRILIVTWCHRVLEPGKSLEPAEKVLLDRICDAYYLPAWCSIADYEALAKDAGLVDIRTEDWSEEVKPFWKGVIKTALTLKGVMGLIKAGPATLRGALVMPLMQTGLATGTIKFNLITARKPAA